MQDSSRPAPRADINVTPLVDVCLVLLIIFLVVTPLLGNHVELPSGPQPDAKSEEDAKVTVAVTWPDHAAWLGGRWLPDREMLDALTELHARNGTKKLVVVADKRLAYGDLRGVLRTAHLAGFPGVELAATREVPAR